MGIISSPALAPSLHHPCKWPVLPGLSAPLLCSRSLFPSHTSALTDVTIPRVSRPPPHLLGNPVLCSPRLGPVRTLGLPSSSSLGASEVSGLRAPSRLSRMQRPSCAFQGRARTSCLQPLRRRSPRHLCVPTSMPCGRSPLSAPRQIPPPPSCYGHQPFQHLCSTSQARSLLACLSWLGFLAYDVSRGRDGQARAPPAPTAAQ